MGEVGRLAWPAILQGMVVTVIFFTDRLLVGRYSAEAIGSMQISGPLLWSVFTVFGAFSAGVVAVIGRSVGAGDSARVHTTLVSVLLFAAVSGVGVGALGLATRPWFADVLGGDATSASLRSLSETYMGIVFLATPLHFVGIAGTTALQASGDTRTPMKISVVVGLLNLALSWVLIYGHWGAPELGIAGAGVGTFAALSGTGALVLVALRRRAEPLSLRRWTAPTLEALAPVLRVAGPTFGEKLVFHGGFLVFAAYIGRLGDVAMAANQVLIAIESMGFIVAAGFGIASGALVAQKLGVGRPDEAAACGWLSAALGVAVLGATGVLFWVVPGPLIGLISQDPEVMAIGVPCLRMAALAQPLMALVEAFSGALRGAGDTRSPLVVTLVSPVVFRLALCWWLAFDLGHGLLGIWIGTTIEWGVRALALGLIFGAGRWRSIEV